MVTVFICSNLGLRLNDFNFYVMGKKYMLSLLSAILVLCNRVESSKITSYFELFRTIFFFILVDEMFQHISVDLSRLIDRLFTNLLNINITETRTEGIKSSDDEEFRIFEL